MKTFPQRMIIAFMASAGIAAHVAAADNATPKEPETMVKGFGSIGTLLVKGADPVIGDDGVARFNVRLNGAMMAAYLTSSTLAVVFDDVMMNRSEVECPVINITGRKRKLEETSPGVITVETAVTPEEKLRVTRAHCVVVTPLPAIREFKFLPRGNQNGNGYSP